MAREDIESHANLDNNAFVQVLERRIFHNRNLRTQVATFGHLSILDYGGIANLLRHYRNTDVHSIYLQIMDNPATRLFYGLTDEHFLPDNLEDRGSGVVMNVASDILEQGRIAYMTIIHGMNPISFEAEQTYLIDFFHQVKDYEHLIIDLRGTTGGNPTYFTQLVIAPNIHEPLVYLARGYLMAGEHNMRFIHAYSHRIQSLTPINHPVFDYEILMENTIHPSQPQGIFRGKIWVLTDAANFSASDHAVSVAGQTGFATLVGTNTSGGGLGMDPTVLPLPNTGVVVRYRAIYIVDEHGRNDYEYGTWPHILPMEGMDALETVLYIINEMEM